MIVNGGLGPTVDDLSQEIAAQAAGVGLVLNEAWLERMGTPAVSAASYHSLRQRASHHEYAPNVARPIAMRMSSTGP